MWEAGCSHLLRDGGCLLSGRRLPRSRGLIGGRLMKRERGLGRDAGRVSSRRAFVRGDIINRGPAQNSCRV